MGRLIDADEVKDAIYKCFDGIQCYDGTGYDIYSDSKESIDEIPTVEAIPKDQYEARLKSDLAAMLIEIASRERWCEYANNNCISRHDVEDLIQQKINSLKEDTNAK